MKECPFCGCSGHENSAPFEQFWALYPRKVGKDAAARAWARRRPPWEKVKAALAWQINSKQWREGIIPNPATWVNQGRWADEQPKPTNGTNGTNGHAGKRYWKPPEFPYAPWPEEGE